VQSHEFVQLTTTEAGVAPYTTLGVWSGDYAAYYYKPGSSESQDWTIRKATGGGPYTSINYGERVFLTNRSAPSQRLCSASARVGPDAVTLVSVQQTSTGGWIIEPV
jgi:hypothetical protein